MCVAVGGLPASKLRHVTEYIQDNLHTELRLGELSGLVHMLAGGVGGPVSPMQVHVASGIALALSELAGGHFQTAIRPPAGEFASARGRL